jgi:hypothetical protein
MDDHGQKPLIIADATHNEHGMKAMLPELLQIPVTSNTSFLDLSMTKTF